MYTVKFGIVIAVLKTLTIYARTSLEDLGMISVRVLDDKNKSYPILFI